MEILEHDDHGMDAALLQQEQLHRLQSAPTALLGVEPLPPRIIDRDVEHPETRRHEGVEGDPEGRQLARDLLSRLEWRLVLNHLKVSPE